MCTTALPILQELERLATGADRGNGLEAGGAEGEGAEVDRLTQVGQRLGSPLQNSSVAPLG